MSEASSTPDEPASSEEARSTAALSPRSQSCGPFAARAGSASSLALPRRLSQEAVLLESTSPEGGVSKIVFSTGVEVDVYELEELCAKVRRGPPPPLPTPTHADCLVFAAAAPGGAL